MGCFVKARQQVCHLNISELFENPFTEMRELYNFLPLSNKQDPPIKGSNTDPADRECVGLKGLVPEDSSLPYMSGYILKFKRL